MKKRIGIDARLYGPISKGLGRYTKEIVNGIINLDKENEYVIFLGPSNESEFIIAKEERNRIKKVVVNARWYTLKEQFVMPYFFKKEKLDLVHIPHFNVPLLIRNKFVVTIHDLILTKFPSLRATTLSPLKYKIKNFGYKAVIKNALRKAEKIITVSNYTKDDIVVQFGVDQKKIVVTYEGVAELDRGGDRDFAAKEDGGAYMNDVDSAKNFIMYVGNAYPHKNLDGLLRIFSLLKSRDSDLKLFMIGKKDYFYEQVEKYAEKLGLNKKDESVFFTGYVSDQDLAKIYRKAKVYVFASKYEGFGLPPLEAMLAGCPVVSSDRSAMPEILGNAAVYFDPDDEVGAATKIETIIKNEEMRKRMIDKGHAKAKEYKWVDCVKETHGVYTQSIK